MGGRLILLLALLCILQLKVFKSGVNGQRVQAALREWEHGLLWQSQAFKYFQMEWNSLKCSSQLGDSLCYLVYLPVSMWAVGEIFAAVWLHPLPLKSLRLGLSHTFFPPSPPFFFFLVLSLGFLVGCFLLVGLMSSGFVCLVACEFCCLV